MKPTASKATTNQLSPHRCLCLLTAGAWALKPPSPRTRSLATAQAASSDLCSSMNVTASVPVPVLSARWELALPAVHLPAAGLTPSTCLRSSIHTRGRSVQPQESAPTLGAPHSCRWAWGWLQTLSPSLVSVTGPCHYTGTAAGPCSWVCARHWPPPPPAAALVPSRGAWRHCWGPR